MKDIKVLIVEDNVIFSMDLKKRIEEFGFTNIIIKNEFTDIVNEVNSLKPEILFMDVCLNYELDGIDIVNKILKNYSPYVIYVTGKNEDDTLSRLVKTNPLGYLSKPVKNNELKFLLFSINNDFNIKDKDTLKIEENLFFKYKEDLLIKNGKKEKLGKKEAGILYLLLKNRGNVVSFKMIEDEVWGNIEVTNDCIRGIISRLRKRIGMKLIKSEYAVGFKII